MVIIHISNYLSGLAYAIFWPALRWKVSECEASERAELSAAP